MIRIQTDFHPVWSDQTKNVFQSWNSSTLYRRGVFWIRFSILFSLVRGAGRPLILHYKKNSENRHYSNKSVIIFLKKKTLFRCLFNLVNRQVGLQNAEKTFNTCRECARGQEFLWNSNRPGWCCHIWLFWLNSTTGDRNMYTLQLSRTSEYSTALHNFSRISKDLLHYHQQLSFFS